MSVQNASPMSVDKSVMSITNDDFNKDISIKSLRRQPKNDRDRFFEVVEYQPDIVAYLKTIEVRILLIFFCGVVQKLCYNDI